MKMHALLVSAVVIAGCGPRSASGEATGLVYTASSAPSEPAVASAGGAALSPDGKLLYVIYNINPGRPPRPMHKSHRLLDTKTGKELWSSDEDCDFAFLPDSKRALLRNKAGLAIVAVPSFEVSRTLHKFPERLTLAVSRDGKLAVTGNADSILTVWDLVEGKEVDHFPTSLGPIRFLHLSPDNKFAFAGCGGCQNVPFLGILDLKTGKLVQVLSDDTKSLIPLCFSPDGTYGVSDRVNDDEKKEDRLVIWDTTTRKDVRQFEERDGRTGGRYSGRANAAAFTADGKFVLTADTDNFLRCWEARTGKLVWSVEIDSKMHFREGALSVHGDVIVTFSGADMWGAGGSKFESMKMKVWSAEGKLIHTFGEED